MTFTRCFITSTLGFKTPKLSLPSLQRKHHERSSIVDQPLRKKSVICIYST